ncbi:hypothetical protein GCM10011487_22380 [Steroidobacter agaridevorans]|uniref:Uncharacterized protein n=1 Tax=Steroidobacter agaridevorans TaxID=2695856 RepID=A0A829YBN7_9GAMM|nr:hypothetical protein [Steroidobacter agaridevorans]GFE80238.1 hypothetical protein GCM10011487_22380 [Steroidobacter agaridevorans]
MSIELSQTPLLSVSEIAGLASQLDVIHSKTVKAIERLNKDIETRKREIASRWKNAAISMEDQARYAQSETIAATRDIRDKAQAELNALLKSAGAPHDTLVSQRQFYDSPVKVLSRAGLGSAERTHYATQLDHAGPSELAHMAQLAVSTKNESLAAAVLGLLDRLPTKERSVSAAHLAKAMKLDAFLKVTEYIKLGDARLQGIIVAVRAFNQGRANPLSTLALTLRERAIEKSIIEERGGSDA